jgi:hypothetical protein
MRLLGVVLVVAGLGGTVWGALAASQRRRPMDLVAALVAPVAFVLALLGGVLVFVPNFLS